MNLNDRLLQQWAGNSGLTPFSSECINPASVDLRWSGRLRIARDNGWSDVDTFESYSLMPGSLYLLDTLEYIKMPEDCVGWLALKSSMGRIGLEHLHAGFVDPSFQGTLTLEIKVMSPWPITLQRCQRIVQLALIRMAETPARGYDQTGRYNGQTVPMPAI